MRNTWIQLLAVLLVAACAPTSPPPRVEDPGDGTWRSALYPEGWSPSSTDGEGRFLHDFSYAGYRNGDVRLPDRPNVPRIDVVDIYGADPTGESDSTGAVQAAIDRAVRAGGGSVYFPDGLYRIDGLLTVDVSNTFFEGEGPERSRLWFTRATGMTGRANLTFRGDVKTGPLLALAGDAESRSTELLVTDAGSLAMGDSIAVGWTITDDFVERHGMAGTWSAFNGQWKTFFRREVTAIDRSRTPHRVTIDVPLRYPALVSDGAGIRVETGYLEECGMAWLGVSNAVDMDAAWSAQRVHAVDFIGTADCFVRDVASFAPPTEPEDGFHLQSGGVRVLDSKRVTIANTSLERAQNRGEGGCGYLFEVSRSSEVLIRDSVGRGGRHNFIQNWDFGTSGLVLLRIQSEGGRALSGRSGISSPGYSEFHHSLAMANLIDDSVFEDGFHALNRGLWSSGAGHTSTESVFWNNRGAGLIESHQFGHGYVIGTTGLKVNESLLSPVYAEGSEPHDWLEGVDEGEGLVPRSLHEDQLARRRAR